MMMPTWLVEGQREERRARRARARRQATTAPASQTTEETEPLAFIWYFAQQKAGTLQRCAPIEFQFEQNVNNATGQVVPVTLPLTFTAAPVGLPPVVVPAVSNLSEPFSWTANFRPGTQFTISFADATGQTGGTGPLYTIAGDGPCAAPPVAAAISYNLNTEGPQTCTPLTATVVSGGVPPYTMTVYKTADRPVNITSLTNTLTWWNTLSASASFIVGVSDALGNFGIDTDVIYSQGGPNISCLISHTSGDHQPGSQPTPPGQSGHSITSYIGAIVGGAVGGAAILAFILLLTWWCRRRKRRGLAGLKRSTLYTDDLPSFEGLQRHVRLPSISSTEKLQAAVGVFRRSDSLTSPTSGSPLDDRPYDYTSVKRSNSRRSQNSFAEGGPDYYTAITSRGGGGGTREGSSGTYRTAGSSSGTQGMTVRQHEDAGQAIGQPNMVVELPPSYGAFAGSADLAAAADLATLRPKGHTGGTL